MCSIVERQMTASNEGIDVINPATEEVIAA